MTSYSGVLLAESLRPDAVLDGIPLAVTKIYRAALGNAEAGQPELWTVIEFEVPADHARELAKALSRLLLVDGGWRLVLRLPFCGGGIRRVRRPHLPLPARRPRRPGQS